MHNWDAETSNLFHAIRRYRKACGKYIAGKPSPEIARERLEIYFTALQDTLKSPNICARLEIVMEAGAAKDSESALELLQSISKKDFDLEMELSSTFGLKKTEVVEAIDPVTHVVDVPLNHIPTANELIVRLDDFHDGLIDRTEAARGIDKRKEKKKRKRSIGQAASSILFGTGCGVANSYLIPGMPYMAVSYGVSLTAFHAAFRDLVGEKPKD